MTRFARAKGSKSSNEKVPEDATPWSELKKGLSMKKEALTEDTKKCVTILKSKTEDKPMEWVSFDDNDESLNLLKKHLEKRRKANKTSGNDDIPEVKHNIKKQKRKLVENEESSLPKIKKTKQAESQDEIIKKLNKVGKTKKKKHIAAGDENGVSKVLNKKKKLGVAVVEDNITQKRKPKKKKVLETSNSEETDKDKVKGKIKKKKQIAAADESNVPKVLKKKKIIDVSVAEGADIEKMKLKKKRNVPETSNDGMAKEKIVKKKRKLKEESTEGNDKKTEKLSKKKKMKTFAGEKTLKNKSKPAKSYQNNSKKYNQNKYNDDKITIDIGGEKVKLVMFQRYYVTEEDCKRLKELRKKMTEEGIPKSQIEEAIKLERRRCEKALARMKKNVCFQCRKPGHRMSDCPNTQENIETAAGVCYKCGSTEHTAFHCKVANAQKFPFAECFICKEKGHIARECPDNPRGLYPKGGCCNLCGDVTHLKKDCTKRMLENEERTIKLGLVDDRNLEGLDDDTVKSGAGGGKKQKKRPVRF